MKENETLARRHVLANDATRKLRGQVDTALLEAVDRVAGELVRAYQAEAVALIRDALKAPHGTPPSVDWRDRARAWLATHGGDRVPDRPCTKDDVTVNGAISGRLKLLCRNCGDVMEAVSNSQVDEVVRRHRTRAISRAYLARQILWSDGVAEIRKVNPSISEATAWNWIEEAAEW